MNSSKSHSARVTATCKHCGSNLSDDFLVSPDKGYVRRAFESMKRNARRLFPKVKDVEIEAEFSSGTGA